MKMKNKENGIQALEEIEQILKKKIREIEEDTGESYKVLIGVDADTDVFMCINLDDYFRTDCWMSQIPFDINWRESTLIKEDLDEIENEINNKYKEHIEMLKELKEVL